MIAIAAVSKNWVMADNDKPLELPWKESEDLKFFKEMTTGKNIICAPKTFQSIRHLKNRKFFLYYKMTGKAKEQFYPEVEGYMPYSCGGGAYQHLDDNYVVVGGAFAYNGLIPDCNKIYLTIFDFEVMIDNPLRFSYDENQLRELGFNNKREFRKITNGTIYEFSKD